MKARKKTRERLEELEWVLETDSDPAVVCERLNVIPATLLGSMNRHLGMLSPTAEAFRVQLSRHVQRLAYHRNR